jgi:molybdopterin molybdotransferase
MISAQEAQAIILDSIQPIGTEAVSLHEAHGRVLALDIVAGESVPGFDNSSMDGYAVRHADLNSAPVVLSIVDEVSAGRTPSREVKRGEAVRITTGGQIPRGADAVVRVEWTELEDDLHVRILKPVGAGQNIRRAGEDIKAGQTVLSSGRELRAPELGVLASLGFDSVTVYQKPRVAILVTGNELTMPDQPLPPGKIRNSNSFTLRGLILESGAIPVDIGIARDDHQEMKEKLVQGLESDVLLTSGGVSVGKYDLMQEVMKEVGVEVKFWKVNIKPGMPLLFGMYGHKPVFGLPGNPVSTTVTFLKFAKPALRKMAGVVNPEMGLRLRAELLHDIEKTDGKRHFIRGIFNTHNGKLTVASTGSQSSGVLTSLVKANCLIIIPEETERLKTGDLVEVELL